MHEKLKLKKIYTTRILELKCKNLIFDIGRKHVH